MIEAETLVSIEELLNSTAAAVQPDDQIYAIVDASDPDAVGEISFREQARKVHFVVLAEAVNQGRITARSMATRMPFREWPPAHMSWERACEVHGVTQADADKFCAELALNRQQLPQPQAAAPAPVVKETPPPVATGDVAHAFDGLRRWNERAWKDTLGSPPKWLEACIALRGERGKRETRWNPVLIGAALVHNGHAKANSIRARFQTKPQLQDWLEAWKTYEADNFDTP